MQETALFPSPQEVLDSVDKAPKEFFELCCAQYYHLKEQKPDKKTKEKYKEFYERWNETTQKTDKNL